MALAFLAVGDVAASLIGRRFGKNQILSKTLEGDLACFISCAITGVAFYFAGLNLPLPIILAGAASASFTEAMPIPLNDNLTMPLLSGALMTLLYLFFS